MVPSKYIFIPPYMVNANVTWHICMHIILDTQKHVINLYFNGFVDTYMLLCCLRWLTVSLDNLIVCICNTLSTLMIGSTCCGVYSKLNDRIVTSNHATNNA